MEINTFENEDIFEIKPTQLSPHVILDKKNQVIKISGNSIMEDSKPFFQLVYNKIKEYLQLPTTSGLKILLHFLYLNTQAVKELLYLTNMLEQSKKPIQIIWYYSDDEINDLGTQLNELSNIPIELKYAQPPETDIRF